jgi:hypothetical protein
MHQAFARSIISRRCSTITRRPPERSTSVAIEKPGHGHKEYWDEKSHIYAFKGQVIAAPETGRAMHLSSML